jgi:hypothetical protein
MPIPESNPLDVATDRMCEARARWHRAKQGGDKVLIEIARADLNEAMAVVDAALDAFEQEVLGGRFSRKRDLPSA